ncbi:MAG TPA: RsmB/NOP family class I SAM-dependent RNA methyltransferase [Bdellovibrionota bacterium]|jgi:16S rRNA (cytosine967-C5)-methyltransferase|nr:RsmB/NOP family class I SAM-dependent RNA methyltransferase [Bdellovibrionota bacterium]
MVSAKLQFSAKQILIHWIQSRVPLERVVAGVFKDSAMGSSERRELQSRLYTWSRYWPLFSSTFDEREIDSPKGTQALVNRIEETWAWGPERWDRLHSKMRPTFADDPRRHLAVVHGANTDILSQLSEPDLLPFHDYLHASLREAPLTIRCRDLETSEALRELYPQLEFTPGAYSPLCLKTSARWAATQSPEYLEGRFEIQDESSQMVSLFCEVQPGMKILDLCAGAGGKTLHLANLLSGKGEIHAWDPSHKKLQELQKRARRWGYTNIQTLGESPRTAEAYDLVLVDAPCSSLGTLRRRPQLLASTSRQDFVRLAGLQRELIEQGLRLVNPSGLVVYATCSVLVSENFGQVKNRARDPLAHSPVLSAFLRTLQDSPSAKISTIPPEDFGVNAAQMSSHDTFSGDGFFVTRLTTK